MGGIMFTIIKVNLISKNLILDIVVTFHFVLLKKSMNSSLFPLAMCKQTGLSNLIRKKNWSKKRKTCIQNHKMIP